MQPRTPAICAVNTAFNIALHLPKCSVLATVTRLLHFAAGLEIDEHQLDISILISFFQTLSYEFCCCSAVDAVLILKDYFIEQKEQIQSCEIGRQ